MPSSPVPIPPKKRIAEVDGPGSQFCGSVYCGSPQLVTRVTATGEVVETWGVPPKPGHETWVPLVSKKNASSKGAKGN
ncbi:hypothetical protein ED733_008389 [Metarhizium rileyi]|uniref:Uncharacterized protein n=1 Tax=Metarhizium rileyi (strain RCEF 4871) TaxID=1649241 RepID=A0A5C6GMU2_METRR|nr:hypothetical protein ED733_008389 [Metarhizium rileyi]